MAEETNQNQAPEVPPSTEPEAKAAKPAAKKEKPPALEDKPFTDYIQQDYIPAIQKAIASEGISDLQLSFVKQKVPVKGMEQLEDCWQIVGSFSKGLCNFNVYFPDEDIQGKKAFSCNDGKKPSTMESFLIDERKVNLDLLIWGLTQRLNSQKWLSRN
ncbi:DUF2996 domain-containing protein [Calothrix sp. 336/3]|uniref:DUF2996 domain-containing protein n=1 Tax=Calothrix sp. 336/3 TaxID=1337936 RepID=UPI0004E44A86|nr:DUF2996 domain-containing protein [Calothrix sp. 336/3]AKG20016.1 hypothetical protein IJ00_00665 [Calothrix sp. 336/3]